METTYEILARALAEQGAAALLIGGQALQAYGVHRQTMDVDCLMVDADAERLGSALGESGFEELLRFENFRRYRHGSQAVMDVDVLLVDQETMDGLQEQSQSFSVGAVEFRIPSLLHLIALKLHAIRNDPEREPRDLADIAELIRINQGDLTAEALREICEQHGPAALVERVMGYLS